MTDARDLMAPMLKRRLYAVFSTLRPGADLGPVLARHLEYMIGLEAQGALFASGPLTAEDGSITGDGLTILRAVSLAEAQAMAAQDPFALEGLRDAEVRPWMLMEGRVGLTVDLSRGTFTFT